MTEHVVGRVDELADGDRLVVEVEGLDIGVFNVGGVLYAYPNWCPHQGGPLCEGRIDGTTEASFDRETLEYELRWEREGRVLRCPWHSWEFDVVENRFLHDTRLSLPSYPVRVSDGRILVTVGR